MDDRSRQFVSLFRNPSQKGVADGFGLIGGNEERIGWFGRTGKQLDRMQTFGAQGKAGEPSALLRNPSQKGVADSFRLIGGNEERIGWFRRAGKQLDRMQTFGAQGKAGEPSVRWCRFAPHSPARSRHGTHFPGEDDCLPEKSGAAASSW